MVVRESLEIVQGGVIPKHLSGRRRVAIHLSLTLKARFFPPNKPIFVWCCRRLFSMMEGGGRDGTCRDGFGRKGGPC